MRERVSLLKPKWAETQLPCKSRGSVTEKTETADLFRCKYFIVSLGFNQCCLFNATELPVQNEFKV